MHSIIPGIFSLLLLEFSRTAFSMSCAAIVLFLIAAWAAKDDVARARGRDKIVALSNFCFALPLAVFGAEHLSAARFIMEAVPPYMPWRLFIAYFVGVALIAAALSIATKICVVWSGLLFGIMMTLFVAMIHLPGALQSHGDRFIWTIVFREMGFAAGGWLLAAKAMSGSGRGKSALMTVGRLLIGVVAIVFGVEFFRAEFFLHSTGVPGIPLQKPMPAWVPAGAFINYLTGAFLVVGGIVILLNRKTRMAATYLGAWILLLVIVIYGPILISSQFDPSTAVKVEGLNYFFDTLLYAGEILALASATSAHD